MLIHKTRKIGATKTRNSALNNVRWLWFIVGLGTGLLLASFLIGIGSGEIFNFKKEKRPQVAISKKKDVSHNTKASAQESTENTKATINYDFYKLLPQQAPEYHLKAREKTNVAPVLPNKATEETAKTRTLPILPKKTNEPTAKTRTLYILHIGEFASLELADQAKAKLALHGINSNIEVINLPTTKYMVIVGSSYNKGDILQKQLMLTKLDIRDTFLITR